MVTTSFAWSDSLKRLFHPVNLLLGSVAVVILVALYFISLRNFILFHGIVELAGITVAFSIFILVWNTRNVIANTFFLIIGISFLFMGSLDLIHTIAYKGMGFFQSDSSDLPTQLWIAARYFQSIAFLVATFCIGKSITRDRDYDAGIIFAACAIACGLLLASIFVWQNFPACFIEGSGLTPFKIISEYIISLLLIATTVLLVIKRQSFETGVWQLLIAAQVFLILGELAFTSYISVYGFMNMLGHLFRLLSVYLFYRAFVVIGLTRPYDLLLRELKKNETALRMKGRELQTIFDKAPSMIFYKDTQDTIIRVNPAAAQFVGMPVDTIEGKKSSDLFPEFAKDYSRDDREVIHSGTPKLGIVEPMITARGEHRWIQADKIPLRDENDTINGVLVFAVDITERKRAEEMLQQKHDDLNEAYEEITLTQEELSQNLDELTKREQQLNDALAEKEILLAEIHHRVKNNLTAFISLLSLEGSTEETPAGRELKKDLQNRARSMALIHETLYRTNKFSEVDMDLYLTPLINQVVYSYRSSQSINTIIDVKGVTLDITRATPAGLIISELVTNSLKYAFPDGTIESRADGDDPCTIGVRLIKENGSCLLIVYDNGIGLPPGYDPLTAKSLGLKLVTFLARHQMRADIEVNTGKGTEFIFRFEE